MFFEYVYFSVWKSTGKGLYFSGAWQKCAFNIDPIWPPPEGAWMFSMVLVFLSVSLRSKQLDCPHWKTNKYISAIMHHPNNAHFRVGFSLTGLVLPGYYIPWKRHVWQLRSVEVWTTASLWDDSAHGPEKSLFLFIPWEEETLQHPSWFYVADDSVWCMGDKVKRKSN